MKKCDFTFIILLLLFFNITNYSQSIENYQYPSYLIFAEGGGPGLMSINFEKYLSQDLGIRAGVGYGLFPIYINYYRGQEKQLELGIGMIYSPYGIYEPFVEKEKTILLGFTIGHKYQPIKED